MSKMISVIVPVYNASAYISDCLESLTAQDDDNFEIIIIDDGSEDGSGDIVKEYADRDKRIRYIKTENRGAAAARNKGIEAVQGELISFVDSDDTVEETYLSALRALMFSTESDIAVCAHNNIYPEAGSKDGEDTLKKNLRAAAGFVKGKAKPYINKASAPQFNYYSGDTGLKALLYQEGFLSVPWGMITNKSLWNDIRFPEGEQAEDMAVIYRLFAAADGIVRSDKKLYNYYHRNSNTMNSTRESRNLAYYRHSREMIAFIKKQYPSCIQAAYSRHFSCCAQILSEGACITDKEFKARVKKDIDILAPKILKDPEARAANRTAAAAALVSSTALAKALETYDKGLKWYLY